MTSRQATPSTMRGDRSSRSTITTAALIIGAVITLAGLVVAAAQWRQDRDDSALTASSSTADTTDPDATGGDTLATLEQQVRANEDDPEAWAALGSAYVDHARVNSDPSVYAKAERALDRSLALAPDGNWQALAAHGALAAGRHDFATALPYVEQARALNPHSSFILGIMVDSLTELGRYREAVDAAQAMVDLRPDLASYARVSYQRELHGDIEGAITAMEDARRASSSPGDRSFADYYLGELEWHRGDIDAAARHYATALRVDPTAMPALAGLGKVAASRGDLDTAIAQYEKAVAGFPDPETIKELAELHLLNGQPRRAERAFRQFEEANATQAAGGVDVNLEIALFSADHRHDLDQGLAAAREEWDRRQSIHVADALAWQLFVHDEHHEALALANRALQLGTPNATFHFHRAEIHRALGNLSEARADYATALSINPHFSFLHGEAARAAMHSLSGA